MYQIDRIVHLMEQGERFCLSTVIASHNPAVPVGLKIIVRPNGTMERGFGSVPLEKRLRSAALEALQEAKRRTVDLGENIHVFLDILSKNVHLLICGAGHIALPLARFAREVGFRVTVLDDRSDFAHPSRFAGCEVIAGNFVSHLRTMAFGPSDYVVVITRGHEHDAECLAEILPKETAYIGLIGSRRRVRFVLDLLGERGIPPHRLDDVFTPIGLPIGSESPGEIALSIASELVCVRRNGSLSAKTLRAAGGINS